MKNTQKYLQYRGRDLGRCKKDARVQVHIPQYIYFTTNFFCTYKMMINLIKSY
jgi:hypothetical protein